MVRKEFVYTMLGHPVIKIEIDDAQFVEVCNRVKRVLAAYKGSLVVSDEIMNFLEEEGVLAHTKYIVARIRAKYERVPNMKTPEDMTLDGRELASEAYDHIKWWHALVENCIISR